MKRFLRTIGWVVVFITFFAAPVLVSGTNIINVTLDTVDSAGNHLPGQVAADEPIYSGTQNAPYTFEMADGGGFIYRASWGGLNTPANWLYNVDMNTTYYIDARTLQVIGTESTPGITKVNFVFIISLTDVTQNLITTIENLNLLQGTENSLTSKLDNVIKLLDAGEENTAINVLNALINQIKALSGKQLTNEEADELIRIIEAIIGSIG